MCVIAKRKGCLRWLAHEARHGYFLSTPFTLACIRPRQNTSIQKFGNNFLSDTVVMCECCNACCPPSKAPLAQKHADVQMQLFCLDHHVTEKKGSNSESWSVTVRKIIRTRECSHDSPLSKVDPCLSVHATAIVFRQVRRNVSSTLCSEKKTSETVAYKLILFFQQKKTSQ